MVVSCESPYEVIYLNGKALVSSFRSEFENEIDCIRLDIWNFSLNKFPLIISEIRTLLWLVILDHALKASEAKSIFSDAFLRAILFCLGLGDFICGQWTILAW